MASTGPPPLSADGLWFWDGSRWKSLLSADGHAVWTGKGWAQLPPGLAGRASMPPSGPPGEASAGAGLVPQPPASTGPPPLPPPPEPPAAPAGEPRPSWLPADAPWPPATFTASPSSALQAGPALPQPAPGPVPWANVYSEVIAGSTSTHGHSYAGFWIRALAYVIDSVIIGVPVTLVVVAFIFAGGGANDPVTTLNDNGATLRLFSGVVGLAYFVSFWSLGSTPGMRVVGIRVADQATLHSIGPGKAFLRYLGFFVSSACCLIGLIWVLFDGRKQGWHDKIAGTVVLHN